MEPAHAGTSLPMMRRKNDVTDFSVNDLVLPRDRYCGRHRVSECGRFLGHIAPTLEMIARPPFRRDQKKHDLRPVESQSSGIGVNLQDNNELWQSGPRCSRSRPREARFGPSSKLPIEAKLDRLSRTRGLYKKRGHSRRSGQSQGGNAREGPLGSGRSLIDW